MHCALFFRLFCKKNEMKKILLIALISTICFSWISAQTTSDLYGKWNFTHVKDQDKLDSTAIKMIKMMFSDLSFEFKEDGNFVFTGMGKTEEGTYKASKNLKKVEMTDKKGKTNTIEVLEISAEEMTVQMRDAILVMQKPKE